MQFNKSPLSKAVTVQIYGGLGNQLFQYATARSLSQRLDVPLYLDLRSFSKSNEREYHLGAFTIAADVANESWLRWQTKGLHRGSLSMLNLYYSLQTQED